MITLSGGGAPAEVETRAPSSLRRALPRQQHPAFELSGKAAGPGFARQYPAAR